MKAIKNKRNNFLPLILGITILLFCGFNLKSNAAPADTTKKIVKIKTIKIVDNDTIIIEKTINIPDEKMFFYSDSIDKFDVSVFINEDIMSDLNKNIEILSDSIKYFIHKDINVDSIMNSIKIINYDSLLKIYGVKVIKINDSICKKLSEIKFISDSNFYKYDFNFKDIDSILKDVEIELKKIKKKKFVNKRNIIIKDLESNLSEEDFIENFKVYSYGDFANVKIGFNKIDKKTTIKIYDENDNVLHEEIIKKTSGNISRRFDIKAKVFYLSIKQGKTIFKKKIIVE